MLDCYKILGVNQNASIAEIKRAYRNKAKKLHPDVNTSNETLEKFQQLVQAYEILSDLRQRSIFDTSYQTYARYTHSHSAEDSFNYRQWLLAREDDESKSKLIFFDLMHNREDDAVELFIKMNSQKVGFSLSRWFTRENFMDFGFILCEELVIRNEYYDAALLLEQIIRMEYTYSYFKLFFPEVIKLARDVYKKHIFGVINDELAIDAFERALELGFGKKDDAFFLEKIAHLYLKMNDVISAKMCILEAFKLDSDVVLSPLVKKQFNTII